MTESFKPTGKYFDLEQIRADVTRAYDTYGTHFGRILSLVHRSSDDQDVFRDAQSRKNWPAGWRMSDFNTFNNLFRGGALHQMWEELRRHYPAARLRIAGLEPRRCYSLHNDEEIRLHYAVETTPKALFLVSDRHRDERNMPVYPNPFHFRLPEFHAYHMPADKQVYMLDANHVHMAMNGGDDLRTHLIIELISTLNDRVSVNV
jgi:hypothetical protein